MSRLRRSTAAAPRGRNLTPFRASGMRATMMRALKITADRMAECGLARRMTLRVRRGGKTSWNMAGVVGEYFATAVAGEKGGSGPRGGRGCVPIVPDSIGVVG